MVIELSCVNKCKLRKKKHSTVLFINWDLHRTRRHLCRLIEKLFDDKIRNRLVEMWIPGKVVPVDVTECYLTKKQE